MNGLFKTVKLFWKMPLNLTVMRSKLFLMSSYQHSC
ncbi:hypothetical protein EPUL_004571 [Erysiphe pulchra]|uniref:Uncharacterized protein n=1 Tax=Erysiphe pulchra TaxID=225359 RepID=A0A2S4PJZ1_9PEZI|nr:hypothetical protein EPUL_004571 [Erysiphe pulchra]